MSDRREEPGAGEPEGRTSAAGYHQLQTESVAVWREHCAFHRLQALDGFA